VTVWQETVTFPLLQCPELVSLPSQQGSVSAAPKAHFRIGTWVAQRTNLCPLSSSQDSTGRDWENEELPTVEKDQVSRPS